jgi:hypothetical protein
MLRKVGDKWALVSKKTLRPLAYYDGEGKPSDEWVLKQERRIQAFKHGFSESLAEAAYEGNIGIMELIKFKQKATDEQKKAFDDHVKNQRHKEAWDVVSGVTGTKLHKSVHEEVKKDILPKAGAGQQGTDVLVDTYIKDTPGQTRKYLSFKEYKKD